MEIFIWGAGDKGKRLYKHLDEKDVIGFIDTDENKIGKMYCEKPIISLEEYCRVYNNKFVVISSLSVNSRGKVWRVFELCDCPAELQEPNARDILKNFIINQFKTNRELTFWGISFFSIMIDKWIHEEFGVHPIIYVPENFDKSELNSIKEEFPYLNLISDEYRDNQVCASLIREKKNGMLDYFDISSSVSEYYNEKIENFRNVHNGEDCFIVATGPSLKSEDLDKLYKEKITCFSVNKIYEIFNKTEWRPNYYCSCDFRAIKENKDLIDEIALNDVFIADSSSEFWEEKHGDNAIRFHHHYEYYKDGIFPKFSDNPARRVYTGLTVVYVCIQLAVYMGFKNIYLLGTDCNYEKSSINNYFYKTDKPDTFNHMVDKTIIAYQSAREYADAHGVKIYNATRGGMLEVFERVDFDTLFDN